MASGGKSVPLRRCTGCGQMHPKAELIRVVRDDTGFSLDTSGKKNGRGAYVCPNADCVAKSAKSRGLERSFKAASPKELYNELAHAAKQTPHGGMA